VRADSAHGSNGLLSDARRLLILGSTGSIGTQALDVYRRGGEIELAGLSAESSWEVLVQQARTHGVSRIALADERAAALAARSWSEGEVLAGAEGLVRLVVEAQADLVLNALVGSAGLGPTVATLGEGIDLALANKESLVVGGPKPPARRSCRWTPSTPRCISCSPGSRRVWSTG